jgi:hypothetical protein
LTIAEKQQINEMSYYEMLKLWRFSEPGHPIFQGATGDYFEKVMAEKKEEIGPEMAVKISKKIGWEK